MVKITDDMVERGVKWCGEHVMMTRAGSEVVRGFLEAVVNAPTEPAHIHDWLLRGAGGAGGGPSTETYTCACGARKEVREWAAPRQRVITTTRTLYCRYVPNKHVSDDTRGDVKDRRAPWSPWTIDGKRSGLKDRRRP